MNLYLDASALVKCYVAEPDSQETIELTERAEAAATSLVSRAEVAATLAKVVRLGLLSSESGREAQRAFLGDWQGIARIPVTEALVSSAGTPAWD